MKKETKILLLLLLLPPALGELLSASSPPAAFFNPVVFSLLVLLYGCGALLMREARVRWDLQWSIVFLAVAYGIIEEGLMVKSFFNPGWVDMGTLSGYGMYLGVQWAWTIMLTFYHATISTLIPIAIIDMLWPEYRDVPVLKKRGIVLVSFGLVFVTLLGMVFMGSWEENGMVPFYPNPLLLVGGFIAVAMLVSSAYKYRDRRLYFDKHRLFSPFAFACAGFLFQAMNLIIPNALAENNVPSIITVPVQIILMAVIVLFAGHQICHKDRTVRHIVAVISGSVMFYILLTPIHEFGGTANPDPTQGMLLVGMVSLVLLVLWRHSVLKNEMN